MEFDFSEFFYNMSRESKFYYNLSKMKSSWHEDLSTFTVIF